MVQVLHKYRDQIKTEHFFPAHDRLSNLNCMLNASARGNIEIVEWGHEVAGFPINDHFHAVLGRDGKFPIQVAIDAGHLIIIDYLLAQDSKIKPTQSTLALIYAVEQNNIEIISYLIEKGVDINAYITMDGEKRKTALIAAIEKNHFDIGKLLIDVPRQST